MGTRGGADCFCGGFTTLACWGGGLADFLPLAFTGVWLSGCVPELSRLKLGGPGSNWLPGLKPGTIGLKLCEAGGSENGGSYGDLVMVRPLSSIILGGWCSGAVLRDLEDG